MTYCKYVNMAAKSGSYSYRNLQKSFISNLNGTTALEISLVTSFAPVSVLLRSLLWQILAGDRLTVEGIFPQSIILLVEYVTLVLPTFLVFTVLADYALVCFLLVLSLITTRLILQSHSVQKQNLSVPVVDNKKRFLSNFRAYVNIATAISILAVDFTIYPRRFAKTETYGTGLMDVGVGSFMIANAVVSQDARGIARTLPLLQAVNKELRAVLVLLGLGLVRFVAVKTTDYQEHVSEYGVHWNFFLTLACVRVVTTIILRTLPESLGKHPWIIGIVIGVFYEGALVNGLEEFVLNGSQGDGSRTNFIDANREGFCSSFGYVALYFIGISIGKLIFCHKYESVRSLLKLLLSLLCIAVLSWSSLWYWGSMSGPERIVSRRLANLPFVLWQVGYNIQLLAFFLLVDILMVCLSPTQTFLRYHGGCTSCSPRSSTAYKHMSTSTETSPVVCNRNVNPVHSKHSSLNSSHDSSHALRSRKLENKTFSHTTEKKNSKTACFCLISAVNYNLLAYFLIANIFTGAVNLSMETIKATQFTAFIIMNVYLLVLHAVIMVFYRRKVLLKF